jgi:hypothetical protein
VIVAFTEEVLLQHGGANEVTAQAAVRRTVCRSSLNQEMSFE